jgi:hypothetical protein
MAHQFNILEELSKANKNRPAEYSVDIKYYRNFIQAIITDAIKNRTAEFNRLGNPEVRPNVLANDLFPYIMYATDKKLTAFFGAKQTFLKFSTKPSFAGKSPRKSINVTINTDNQPNFSILSLFIKVTFDEIFANQNFDIATIHTALNVEV